MPEETDTCGVTGEHASVPFPHSHSCWKDPNHEGLHGCLCGHVWSDELEAVVGFELSDEELLTIDEFLKVRDHAVRMNAFSIGVDGQLTRRVGALLERMRAC